MGEAEERWREEEEERKGGRETAGLGGGALGWGDTGEAPTLSSASRLGSSCLPTMWEQGGHFHLEEEDPAELLHQTHERCCHPLVPACTQGSFVVIHCAPDAADKWRVRMTRSLPS